MTWLGPFDAAGGGGAIGVHAITMVCAAMLCAGVAAWLFAGPDDGFRRARLLLAGTGEAAVAAEGSGTDITDITGGADGSEVRVYPALRAFRAPWAFLKLRFGSLGHEWWGPLGGGVLSLLGESVLPLAAGIVTVPFLRRLLRARDARRAAELRRAAVIALCAAVVGELRAGRLPDRALLAAGADGLAEEGPALLAAARFAGDVPAALRDAARRPGAEGLLGVAACWQVSADGGAGLAAGLDRVAGALRAEREQREELRAQLAGPRSTALVLALLPVFGLLLGSAMGADPLRVLLHSPAGLGCLVLGGLLEWAGLAWVARLVRAAEEGCDA